jgi:hypothetical protein
MEEGGRVEEELGAEERVGKGEGRTQVDHCMCLANGHIATCCDCMYSHHFGTSPMLHAIGSVKGKERRRGWGHCIPYPYPGDLLCFQYYVWLLVMVVMPSLLLEQANMSHYSTCPCWQSKVEITHFRVSLEGSLWVIAVTGLYKYDFTCRECGFECGHMSSTPKIVKSIPKGWKLSTAQFGCYQNLIQRANSNLDLWKDIVRKGD